MRRSRWCDKARLRCEDDQTIIEHLHDARMHVMINRANGCCCRKTPELRLERGNAIDCCVWLTDQQFVHDGAQKEHDAARLQVEIVQSQRNRQRQKIEKTCQQYDNCRTKQITSERQQTLECRKDWAATNDLRIVWRSRARAAARTRVAPSFDFSNVRISKVFVSVLSRQVWDFRNVFFFKKKRMNYHSWTGRFQFRQ